MRWSVIILFLAAVGASGCASRLSEAKTHVLEARYPQALAQYRALRPELPRMSPAELFEYALYRGLSHLALGDAQPASRWLTLAKRLSEQTPGVADVEASGQLLSAWRSMGYMPGE